MLKTICVEVIAGLIEHLGKSIFQFNNILIDSRKIEPGDAFIGIKGRNTDGNLYATEALKRGASFVVVDNDEIYRGLNGNKILVRDSFRALKSIGAFYLENYDGLTVAITGSAGKTSTKELLYTVLSRKFQVYRNYKNYNNALGLALCSANLDMGSDIAIFECGTNGKGEILELSNYLLPDITIITNIGYSHIGHFGSLEEIAKEKLSIIEPLTVQELWINNSDYKKYNHLIDKLVHVKTFAYKKDLNANIYIDKLEYVNNKIHFNVCYKNRTRQYILNHFFTHLAYDALPAIALAIDMGIPEKLICESLAQYIPLSGRGCMINIDNITIVDDTYNASYDAIIASLNSLSIRNEEKIVILGSMAEIEGHETFLYKKLYEHAVNNSDIYYIFVGKEYAHFKELKHIKIVKTKEEALKSAKSIINGKKIPCTILVKGARKNAFEEIVERMAFPGVLQDVV